MPSENSSPDEVLCRNCGHRRDWHSRPGFCAGDVLTPQGDDRNNCPCKIFWPAHLPTAGPIDLRSAPAETAGCKHPNRIQITGDKLRRHGRLGFVCHDCGEAWTETAGEPEAPKCVNCDAPPAEGYSYCDNCMTEPEAPCLHESWEVTGERPAEGGWLKWRKCADCREPLPDIIEAEPHWDIQPAEPDPEPPRRPPYAVAYEIQGGARFEIALPGDATVSAENGALVITHSSAVTAMTQFKPWEGA